MVIQEPTAMRWTTVDEFERLVQHGMLGCYNSCEITHAFVMDRETDDRYNLFTIFVMEERNIRSPKPGGVSPKLITVSDRFSLGAYRWQVSPIARRKAHFEFAELGEHSCGQIDLIQRQFIPADDSANRMPNRILKNNFRNGSYILEFFDAHVP